MSFSPLDLLIPAAHAAQGSAAGGAQQSSWLSLAFPFLLLIVFYFLLIRPQMRRSKEQRQMIDQLAKGDEVVTTGGLTGKLTGLGESYVTLEIADKIEVKVQKSAISGVLPKGTLKTL